MDAVLTTFLQKSRLWRKELKKIILFGSRARGDERPESDYDLLILVDAKDRKLIDQLYDVVVYILLQYSRLISLKIFTLQEWNRLLSLKTPFSQAVIKEGKIIG